MSRRAFVDAHVHLWDRTINPWYGSFPEIGANVLGWTVKVPWPDRFYWPDYAASVSSVDLVKWVHVTAVDDPRNVEAETAWLESIVAPHMSLPYVIIGSIDPTQPLAAIEADLDRQMRRPGFRGIRLLSGIDYASPLAASLMAALAERGLVYDLNVFPADMRAAAACLSRQPDLAVVLEHTGLPGGTGDAAFAEWRAEIAGLAALPNVTCKLSGLIMTVHHFDPTVFRRYGEEAIRLFGADRCMFATNFPVDCTYGTAADMFAMFEAVAAGCSDDEAERLYVRTAEQVYRL
jgi:L-fuconolactonase